MKNDCGVLTEAKSIHSSRWDSRERHQQANLSPMRPTELLFFLQGPLPPIWTPSFGKPTPQKISCTPPLVPKALWASFLSMPFSGALSAQLFFS